MGLAWEITGNNADWTCIWPTKKPVWENYPWASKCERADISNLLGKNSVSFAMMPKTTPRDDYLHAIRLLIAGDSKVGRVREWTTGRGAGSLIKSAADQGNTPISWAVIGGHSGGEAVLGNEQSGMPFSPFDIPDADNFNTYDNAVERHGPSRCWFTRDAQVWALGCSTSAFARAFAERVLRVGATAYGTHTFVNGRWRGRNASISFVGYPGWHSTLGAALAVDGPWVSHPGRL